jgi:hypothetical protein
VRAGYLPGTTSAFVILGLGTTNETASRTVRIREAVAHLSSSRLRHISIVCRNLSFRSSTWRIIFPNSSSGGGIEPKPAVTQNGDDRELVHQRRVPVYPIGRSKIFWHQSRAPTARPFAPNSRHRLGEQSQSSRPVGPTSQPRVPPNISPHPLYWTLLLRQRLYTLQILGHRSGTVA